MADHTGTADILVRALVDLTEAAKDMALSQRNPSAHIPIPALLAKVISVSSMN